MEHFGINELNVSAHLVEKQIRLWNARCRALDEKAGDDGGFHFLTIAKDEGSLGNEIIQELSLRLGWHVFDEEIIHFIAQNGHVSEKLVQQLDQKSQNSIQEMIERFLKTIEADSFSADEYHEGLFKTLACLANQGSAILVGRGGNFLLIGETHGLKIRITASPEVRIQRLAESWKVSVDEARIQMQANDEEKRKFIRHYYWHDYDDVKYYDAIFNTNRTSVENIVSSIEGLINPAQAAGKIC